MLKLSESLLFLQAERCIDLYESFQESAAVRVLWRQLKPMLLGYLLYTPNTPAVNKVIQRVSNI